MPLALLFVPVLATFSGGLLALRLHKSLSTLIAAGAGLLLGAAFLDLLPEALSLAAGLNESPADVLGITLLAYLGFYGLQNLLDSAAARWSGSGHALGQVGGALLVLHSLRDGMAIGLSFAASHAAGYAVAAGIAAHDLGDGMNTVIITTRQRKAGRGTYAFLLADALAPLLGGMLTVWWTFPARDSVALLAVAAGFFLQMATNDFLPEIGKRSGSARVLWPAVLGGAALIYLANVLTGRLH